MGAEAETGFYALGDLVEAAQRAQDQICTELRTLLLADEHERTRRP